MKVDDIFGYDKLVAAENWVAHASRVLHLASRRMFCRKRSSKPRPLLTSARHAEALGLGGTSDRCFPWLAIAPWLAGALAKVAGRRRLMSLRENAPYADALDEVTGMLTYEGHNDHHTFEWYEDRGNGQEAKTMEINYYTRKK
jgi:hypothetical protein